VGQGALAVECRQEDVQTLAILSALHHRYGTYFQYLVHYAVGQGAPAVECRQEDVQTLAILSALHHRYIQYTSPWAREP
jgi:porphobilinogen deaminase